MSKIREKLTRENIVSGISRIGSLRVKLSHSTLLEITLLVLILTLAFTVRLLPMRWGYYLSEFDPYFQFRITDHFVTNGLFSFTTWTNDPLSWWPWGRDVPHTAFPALGLTAATFYGVLNALGVPMTPAVTINPLSLDPVYNFVIVFPAIMAVIACVVIYLFGKDIGGKETGLFAALFLAINASYIGRTSLGFFDDETIGVLGILLIGFLFLRSIDSERSFRQSFFYAVFSGLALGYLFAGWGASRYPEGLLMLLVGVMLLLRRYSPRLLMSYSLTFGIGLFIATNVPFLGPKFLTEITNVAAYALLLVLVAFELFRHVHTVRMKYVFVLACFAIFAVLFIGLDVTGVVTNIGSKYQAIINPFQRLLYPIVESVQENRPAAWGSIYYDIGIGAFFIPVGFFFAAQNPTNRNVYLILFGLTTIYFASSIVRLSLILAPAFCLLWALALVKLMRPFITVLKETPATIRRRARFGTHVGREFSAAFLILIFILLSISLVFPTRESQYPRFIDQAYSPTTIAVASTPYKTDKAITDWFDALAWIRNTPNVQVVASWWDYGYWITTIGNKPSLADNGTFNSTQIGLLGRMFLSNETGAYAMIQNWNREGIALGRTNRISHVLVFTTFKSDGTDLNAGDEAKWVWMARIGGLNDTLYGNVTSSNVNWTALGKTTIIYKFMEYAKSQRVSTVTAPALNMSLFRPAYFSNMNLPEADRAVNGINAVVAIYEVVYPDTKT